MKENDTQIKKDGEKVSYRVMRSHGEVLKDNVNKSEGIYWIKEIYLKYTQQKKFLDTDKSSIFTKMLHIRQIKSLLC